MINPDILFGFSLGLTIGATLCGIIFFVVNLKGEGRK